MSTTTWKRWIPVAVVPLAVAATAVALPLSASAAGDLPEKSPSELLAFVAENDVTAFSGEIEQTADLGLPDLSALGVSGGSSASVDSSPVDALVELATLPHEARVYVDAERGVRLQVLDRLAERDILATRSEGVWMYDSSGNSVHHVLPPEDATGAPAAAEPSDEVPTPSAVAETLLAELDPTTAVAVGSDVRVAGRDAYELVLTPRDATTLVGSVTISVDGETGLPLGFSVTAKGGSAPVFRAAYSSIDLATPDSSMFSFTPPPGADLTESAAPATDSEAPTPSIPDADAGNEADGEHPVVVAGSGWGSVVELPAVDPGSLGALDAVTTATDGGRVLSSALVTVLITDDGRVLAGAVPAEALRAAAGR